MLYSDDPRPKREIAIMCRVTPEELRAIEKLMTRRGFRQRGPALVWALLVVAGAHELARARLPAIARRRALDRRDLVVTTARPADD